MDTTPGGRWCPGTGRLQAFELILAFEDVAIVARRVLPHATLGALDAFSNQAGPAAMAALPKVEAKRVELRLQAAVHTGTEPPGTGTELITRSRKM